jgi:hypothetical protein
MSVGQVSKAPPASSNKPKMDDFTLDDPKMFSKELKNLSTVTSQDVIMHKRQKTGQLRIGDVICLSYIEEIFSDIMKK